VKDISLSVYREWEFEQDEHWFVGVFLLFKVTWCIPSRLDAVRYRETYRHNEEFAIKERLRRQIKKKAMVNGSMPDIIRAALNTGGNSSTVEQLLGYPVSAIKDRFESLFVDGMTWGKFRSGEIHIDHIKSQCLFDLSSLDGFKECWSLDNLQPLWAAGLVKSGSWKLFCG